MPNIDFQREHALRKADIRNGLRLGGGIVPWKAVAYANLFVKVSSDGKVQVSRFKRCQFCQRDFPIDTDWYLGLSLL